jgi:hypothetical protein
MILNLISSEMAAFAGAGIGNVLQAKDEIWI